MPHPDIPCLKYDEFAMTLGQGLKGRRAPLVAGIELTERCNLRCRHCFINRSSSDYKARSKELSTAEFCKLIDELADRECLCLQITGGEPLLRPDFADIYLHAKRRGLLINLFTNGTLITPRLADLLEKFPPRMIEVSIYGATSKIYERVTNVVGSFDKCMAGISHLKARGLRFVLKTMLMTINKTELVQMKELANKLGVDFRFDPLIQSRFNGDGGPRNLRLTPKEILELDLADEKLARSWIEFCKRHLGQVSDDRVFGCGVGRLTAYFDPYGYLMPCMQLKRTKYNLKEGSFDDGFYNFFPQVYSRKTSRKTACTSCQLRALCYQCPAWSQSEHGDDETPVDFLCEITKLRFKKFAKGVYDEERRKKEEVQQAGHQAGVAGA